MFVAALLALESAQSILNYIVPLSSPRPLLQPLPASLDSLAPCQATLAEQAGVARLDVALSKTFPQWSRSRLQTWIRAGRVSLAGQPCLDPTQKVYGGEHITLAPAPDPSAHADRPEAIALNIVFEDATLLVLNKPAGLVVHPGNGNWSGTLLNALLHHAPDLTGVPRAGIVHRLDKDTSGLLVVAKTLAAQTQLVRQLQARTVKREYLAVVQGVLARDGVIEAPIGRDPSVRTRMAVVAGGRESRTHYRSLRVLRGASLVECALDTGRTHQIRVHMRAIGHPIVGDPLYGRRPAARASADAPALVGFSRQALHATRLALNHPTSGQALSWRAPLPSDMDALVKALA